MPFVDDAAFEHFWVEVSEILVVVLSWKTLLIRVPVEE
jgi:hypothetical protein